MSIRPVGPSTGTTSPSTLGNAPSGTTAATAVPTVSGVAGSGSSSEAVHLSGDVQSLRQAVQDPSNDVSVAQVEALRLDVLAGTYQPNPRAIADGLIASVRELLKTRPRSPRRTP